MSVRDRVLIRHGVWSSGRLLPNVAAYAATVAAKWMGHTPMSEHGQYPQEPAVALQFDDGPLVAMFERYAEALLETNA